MSHITKYQHVISDVKTFCQLAREKGFSVVEATEGIDVRLFGSNTVKDAQASIHIEGWKYAVAINQKGEILYDHWGSKAGSMERLHQLMQDYNQTVIFNNIPMDIVDGYHVEELENGDKQLVLTYAP